MSCPILKKYHPLKIKIKGQEKTWRVFWGARNPPRDYRRLGSKFCVEIQIQFIFYSLLFHFSKWIHHYKFIITDLEDYHITIVIDQIQIKPHHNHLKCPTSKYTKPILLLEYRDVISPKKALKHDYLAQNLLLINSTLINPLNFIWIRKMNQKWIENKTTKMNWIWNKEIKKISIMTLFQKWDSEMR